MFIRASVGRMLLHSKFLIERDMLSATFSRLGSGFNPPSVFEDARVQIENIHRLLEEFDKLKVKPSNDLIENPIQKILQSDHIHIEAKEEEFLVPRKALKKESLLQ